MVVLFGGGGGGTGFLWDFLVISFEYGDGAKASFSRSSPFFSEQANSLVFCFTHLDDRRLNRVILTLYP